MVTGTTVEIVRVDDRHIVALTDFYCEVWDRTATPDRVRQARALAAEMNPVFPGEDFPTFLFLQNGRALGHVTTIPVRLRAGGVERPGHWLKGLMVVPEHRNGPVGMLLLKEAVKQLGLAMAMVVQPAPRRLFQALGFSDLGAIPNLIKVLRGSRVLGAVDVEALGLTGAGRAAVRFTQAVGLAGAAGAVVGAGLRLWGALAGWTGGWGRGAVRTAHAAALDVAAADALWDTVRPSLSAAPCRDGRMLRWRYGLRQPYHLVTVTAGGRLRGLAVVREPSGEGDPRLKGIRVATLSDLLFAPGETAVGLTCLAGAEGAARALGADALLCSASHRSLAPLLRRRAFLPVGANVHFMIRDPAPIPLGAGSPPELADWWLTRGDSSADEVF